MGEGSAATSVATVNNKRKSIASGGGNASRATTPTTSNTDGVSKKRPRTETPSGSNTSAESVTKERTNDENENSCNTIGNTGVKKKKKHGSVGPGESSNSSSTLTFDDEIANASSEATMDLLALSLGRLTDGIPQRELKMIVSEARACEVALENELRVLKEGLRIEETQNQNPKRFEAVGTDNKSDVAASSRKSSRDPSQTKTADRSLASITEKENCERQEPKEFSSTPSITTTSSLTQKELASLETMLESEFTPPDTHWTLSTLLGRLRHELTTPLPPRSQLPVHRDKQGLTQLALNVGMTSHSTYKKRGPKPQLQIQLHAHQTTTGSATSNSTTNASGGGTATANTTNDVNSDAAALEKNETTRSSSSTTPKKIPDKASISPTTLPSSSLPPPSLLNEASQFKRLASLPDHPEYKRNHVTPDKILAVWKKLSTHRSSLVFRRPVNPKEAPGYTDRIRFPMDLSLIRKLVLSKHIQTFEGILKQVHLIGHNCVKYNGRESDYALVTREFESVATEYVWNAVMKETYGGGRGRWSRNASPMPMSASSFAPAAQPASAPAAPAPAGRAAPKPTVATASGTTANESAPAIAGSAPGSSSKS
eukprot:CAMPEP_0197185452 /NCGR_PEP_ID=MMETSP1423-20130617/11960_1 /TAXON_ID=476441 /ORGANISM="Pseudo-nitzschia heimii, Strain UNC1101" /LENGTH=598 /DNA_ID=CAMNT_0042636517 /DNA_START=47 /DNA_END=1843 /DNA_ORIENTATION=-